MGIETALIGGIASGIGGAVSGAKGKPSQTTTSDKSGQSSEKTVFAPQSELERQLQEASLQNYLAQQRLGGAYDFSTDRAQQFQDMSRQGVEGILGGQAMQMTPQEQQNIQNLRQSMIDQGSSDVNRMLDERLSQLNQSAANRGVRGQALSQLQTGALQAGAQQMGDITRQANQIAAQESISAPYRRMQAQSPFLAQGMTLADQMRLQAQQNRQALQNPYLLNLMRQERMAGGETQRKYSETGTDTQQGQQGSFGDALLGGMGGFFGGASAGANFASGMRDLGWGGGGGGSGGGGGFNLGVNTSMPRFVS